MSTVVSVAKSEVPVYRDVDVVVVGGGIAGISAAVAAARKGKSVVLLEKQAALGGLATLGHVCIYLPLDDGSGNRIFGGLSEELLYTTIKYGYNTLAGCWKKGIDRVEAPEDRYQTHFNIPAAVFAFDELCENEKVETLFDMVSSEPVMDGNRVNGVICESKQGRVAIMGKAFIDASGDVDLMARAGAKTVKKDSICSHWTYELDFEQMKKGMEYGDVLHCLKLRWLGLRPNMDNENSVIPKFCGTSIEGVNSYLKTSRKLGLDYLKKNQRPDYAMLTLPGMPQFRTSQHIVGVESISYRDDADKRNENSVGIICWGLADPSPVFEYPYGGLIDSRIENVFAAGRIVACDEDKGWEMMRLIPACAFTGEVSGTAAAQLIDEGVAAQELDVSRLQKTLESGGITIHMNERMKGNVNKLKYDKPKSISCPLIFADALAYDDAHSKLAVSE